VTDEKYNWDFQEVDLEELLEQSNEQERQRLDAELERIEQELSKRDTLRDQAIDDLESKVEWYGDRLAMLYKRSMGKHGERERVKGRLESLYRALRDERRTHWRDRQELLATRRDIQRELDALDEFDLLEFL